MSDNRLKKSFWQRPEGVTGTLFLVAALGAGLYFGGQSLNLILEFLNTTLGLISSVALIGVIAFLAIDRRSRNLISYGYKSVMRWITGIFVQLDHISILKSYLDEMKKNIRDMRKQIGALRGQMRRLKTIIDQNKRDIDNNMRQAQKAKQTDNQAQVVLKARKAGRLRDSNLKLEDLYKRMEVLNRVLEKMYQNSEILYEDTKDQVKIKEQERKAIRASHSAMRSAMNIINGNSDRREMFDQAMEAIAEDVADKVGEMERFMDVSKNFMDGIDLQNGVFEEQGLEMLEKWERESTSLLLGDEKIKLLNEGNHQIDLNQKRPRKNVNRNPKGNNNNNEYTNLFD